LASAGCELTESASEAGLSDAAVSSKRARWPRAWNAPPSGESDIRRALVTIDKASPDAGYLAADSGKTERPPLSDAGAPPNVGHDAASEPTPATPARLLAYSAPSASAAEPMPAAFSVSDVRELYIYSVHSALVGEHRELRRFYAPSDDLYYEKLVAYSTELDEPAPFVAPVSVPRSKQIAAVRPDDNGRLIIEDVFPVAGTWISDRAMTGTWRVELYLDGAAQPSATLQLELVP
jgi:hypothetical protein